MTQKQSMFVFIVGMLMTFGAVGGIENSVENSALLASMIVAIIGLLTMYCGVLGLRNSELY